MNTPAIYALFMATIGVPMIAGYWHMRDALFGLFRLSSSMIGSPWP